MIRAGLVGLGRIADVHYPAYRRFKGAQLYAVCDVNEDVVQNRKKQWKAAKAYGNFQDLLEDPKVDAVEILTPHGLHEKMVIDALQAGKHVAVQKPMTISLQSADRMLEAARKSGKIFKVTDNYAFYPPIEMAKKLIADDVIGDPLNLTIHFVGGGQGGWEVPSTAWEWRVRENEEGGGTRGLDTFDHGHHLWTTAWYLLGDVERVSAWIDSADGIVDSPSTVMWKHCNGKVYGMCEFYHGADLEIPSKYYANDEWLQIGGTKGLLFVNRCTGDIHDGPAVSTFTSKGWKHYPRVKSDWGEGFIGAGANFFRAIEGIEKPLLSGEDARTVLRFSLAVQKSSQIRREVYADELDKKFPALYAYRRRNKEIREAANKKGFFARIFGEGTSRYAPQAHQCTMALLDEVDSKKAGDWECEFGLILQEDGGVQKKDYSFCVKKGTISCTEGALPEKPVFVLSAPAGVWAAILLGKKRIETAFIQGKVKVEGRAEEALKLRSVFGI